VCSDEGLEFEDSASEPEGTFPVDSGFALSSFDMRWRPNTLAFSSSGSSSRSSWGVSAPLLGVTLDRRVAEMPPSAESAGVRKGDGVKSMVGWSWGVPTMAGVLRPGVPRGGILGIEGVPTYCARRARRSGVPTGGVDWTANSAAVARGLFMLRGLEGEDMSVRRREEREPVRGRGVRLGSVLEVIEFNCRAREHNRSSVLLSRLHENLLCSK
jgi:hypothetical protein